MMPARLRRRRLPHLDVDGATYFVTSCLAGSIPAQGLLDLDRYERQTLRKRLPGLTPEQWRVRSWKLRFARADYWLDHQPASRELQDERLATEVVKSMHHFAGTRYDLLSFVVMPSHFHWVFRPRDEWASQLPSDPDSPSPREVVMHSLKRFAARKCNELLGKRGAFWQDESYDHCVRDEDELWRIMEYVELNPVKARLAGDVEGWRFSSAYDRKRWNVSAASPLVLMKDIEAG